MPEHRHHIDTDHTAAFAELLDTELCPGCRVQTLAMLEPIYRATLHDAVQDWRAQGATWQDVAGVWGISRQAAWERFHSSHDADLDPR